MKSFYLSLISISLLCSLTFTSCSSDDEEPIKSLTESQITEALISKNNEVLKTEINAYFSQFPTNKSTSDDEYMKIFNSLIENFNSLDGIKVFSSCFKCIYTALQQSEISIEIETSSGTITRILDLYVNPKTYEFQFLNTH